MNDTAIAFFRTAPGLRDRSDGDLLPGLSWQPGAHPALVKAARQGDSLRFAKALRQAGLGRLGRTRGRAAEKGMSLWGRVGDAPRPRALAELWQRMGAGPPTPRHQSRVAEWLRSAEAPLSAFELLVLFDLLSSVGRDLRPDLLWSLWRRCFLGAHDLSLAPPDGRTRERSPAPGADSSPCGTGELLWQAGLLFSDLRGADRLRRTGRDCLRRELSRCTDPRGMPHAAQLPELPERLAEFVRAAEWSRRAGEPLWDAAAGERFRLLARNAILLCQPDGRLALTNGRAGNQAPLLAAASRLAGLSATDPPRKYVRVLASNGQPRRPMGARRSSRRRPHSGSAPAVQSDAARLACLRSDWSAEADSLFLAHHREKPLLELAAFGRPLLSGVWDIDVAIDGDPLAWEGRWDCVCWYSDDDCDYVELQISLSGGLRIERQALLSRTDRFAVLADAVSGARSARIDYASRLPLAKDVRATADTATRECLLGGPSGLHAGTRRRTGARDRAAVEPSARVFPLALPCERVLGTAGVFTPDGVEIPPGAGIGLELRQAAVGGLYAPLFLDWNPVRGGRRADWRALTVTEDGRILKTDAAAGHRIRIGNHQWLIYRALKKPQGPRSVLGHHTAHETVIGRFEATGDVTPVLLVE